MWLALFPCFSSRVSISKYNTNNGDIGIPPASQSYSKPLSTYVHKTVAIGLYVAISVRQRESIVPTDQDSSEECRSYATVLAVSFEAQTCANDAFPFPLSIWLSDKLT